MKKAELNAIGYAPLFSTGQYGKLYITSSSHARGAELHIQILPEGVEAKPNGTSNMCLNSDAVEVYGVIAGQLGWSEKYGWLHRGKWEEDFHKLVVDKLQQKEHDEIVQKVKSKAIELDTETRTKDLLSRY